MKFCRQCAEYVSDHHKECPSCGYVFPEQSAGKPKHYCTRCKRHLLSNICPIHGTESTVKIESAIANASTAKPQFHQPKRETSIPIAGHKPYLSSAVEKALPPLSRPSTIEEKNQADSTHPVPLSRPGVSPIARSTVSFSERQRAERQNMDTVLNPVTKKQQKNTLTTSTVNSANNRQSGTFSSQQESSQAIIEGKLSSLLENKNSDLIPGSRRKSLERRKTDQKKRGKSAPKSSVSSANPSVAKSFKNKVPGWIYWVGSFTLMIATVMILYSFYYPDYAKKSLFSRAEEHFQEGRYEAALQLYREYKMRYPGNDVIPAVNERINQIRENESARIQKQIKIYSLMKKAAESYNKKRFLKPYDENAMMYIREALQEDPAFVPALALQNRIVDFYFEQAAKAFDEDRYDRAVMYYENILAIRPTDTKIQADLDRALKLKYVYGMLDDMSSLADAPQELKIFQEEKSRLKNQIRQERQKLREVSQELENKQNDASKGSNTVDKKSSSQEVLNAQSISAGLTYLYKNSPAIDNQPLEFSLNENQRQSDKNSEGLTLPVPGKYQLTSDLETEPIQFKSKKRASY
jgi:TolA-binding protein/RNA polymerase subunit RPABC4/transcription elongation factor Spt4